MKLHRIWALNLRYLYLMRHSVDRMSDMLYWPALDLLLWGVAGTYFQSYATQASAIVLIIISGIVFWFIVIRGQYEIAVNLLEELWNKNLVNLFVSPLSFAEWIGSFLIVSIAKAAVGFAFAALLAFFLYRVEIFLYGVYLLPFALSLLITGWSIGFVIAGFILRYGTKLQAMAWTLVWAVAPFSAVYYPVSILPLWAEKVAMVLPTSYIFEGSREVIATGHLSPEKLYVSLGLGALYFALALFFLWRSFRKALAKGLVKVY